MSLQMAAVCFEFKKKNVVYRMQIDLRNFEKLFFEVP